MKESICNDVIVAKKHEDERKYWNDKLEPYLALAKTKRGFFSTNYTMSYYNGRDKIVIYYNYNEVAIINLIESTIKVMDELLYEPLKEFGEENDFKELFKCWHGVV